MLKPIVSIFQPYHIVRFKREEDNPCDELRENISIKKDLGNYKELYKVLMLYISNRISILVNLLAILVQKCSIYR